MGWPCREEQAQVSLGVLRTVSVSIKAEVEKWSHPECLRLKRDLQVVEQIFQGILGWDGKGSGGGFRGAGES